MSRTRLQAEKDVLILLNKVRKHGHGSTRQLQYIHVGSGNLFASDGRILLAAYGLNLPVMPDGPHTVLKGELTPIPQNTANQQDTFPVGKLEDTVKECRNSHIYDSTWVTTCDTNLISHFHKNGLLIDWVKYGPILQKIQQMNIGMVEVFIHKSDKKKPVLIRFGIPSGIDSFYGVVNIGIMPVYVPK